MSRLNEREIARKLAEREELEPPAGLLEKIKGEIPPSIPVGTEAPEVETRSPAAPRQRWLMAASVVAMIGAGLLALQVRTPMAPVAETAGSKALPQKRDRVQEAPSGPPPAARMSPPQEAKPLLGDEPAPPPPPPPPPPKPSRKEMDELKSLGYVTSREEGGVERGVAGGVVGGVPGGVAGGMVGAPQEPAPAVQPVEAPERAPAAPAPAPQAAAKQERRADAAADSPLRIAGETAAMAEMEKPRSDVRQKSAGIDPFRDTATQPFSTFETDSGTASYELVRRSLLQGKLPDPGAIRVGEVLNGFETGGVPPVEGAPTPFLDSRYRLLCFRLPAGRRVEVEFNPEVVARYRLLGSGLSTLYEIELRPGAPRDGRVATVRSGDREERELVLSAVASSWQSASSGFRLSALAAELAEILKGSSRADLAEVARQARDAQKGLPKGARAAELADLVEKAARIKGSEE